MRPAEMTSDEREELARLRRENRQFRQERDLLARGEPSKAPSARARWRTPGLRRPRTGIRVDADQPSRLPCPRHGTRLGVAASGFQDWRDRRPSDRQGSDAVLLCRIRTIHAVSHETYGVLCIHTELWAKGRVRPSRAQARGAADVRGRDRGCEPQARSGLPRTGGGAPLAVATALRASKRISVGDLVRRWTQQAVDGRHRVRADRRGLPLSRPLPSGSDLWRHDGSILDAWFRVRHGLEPVAAHALPSGGRSATT